MTAEEAVERYGRLVLDVAWRVTRCPEETRDVYQETFLKLHEGLTRGESFPHPKAWLCRTALNAALKRVHRRRRETPLDEGAGPTWDAGSLADVEREQLVLQVRRRVGDLPPRQQEAFVLRFYQGLAYEEIATILDCEPGAARVAVFHALKKLRGWLCADPQIQRQTKGP